MAIRYRTRGFVLKKENQGESNQIFTLYTENFGKLKVLGRAIRKIKSKLRAGIRVFCFSEIEFIQGKVYNTLTEAVIINSFKDVGQSLEKLRIAYAISNLLDNLIKGAEPDRDIWGLLCDIFDKLNRWEINDWKSDLTKKRSRLTIIYHYFFWNLLSILGYKINLYKCSFCQKKLVPKEIYLNLDKGLICSNCFKKIKKGSKISPEIVKILRLFLRKDWPIISKLKITDNYQKSLNSISENYFMNLISG